MEIKKILNVDKNIINEIISIHLLAFQGFFLSFMGRGFLKLIYSSYIEHNNSGILVAYENKRIVGFLAYSSDLSGLYKFMIKKKILLFAWYSLGAFLRKPSIFIRLGKAFFMLCEAKRDEKYVELASIGVAPNVKSKGIGSNLINVLKTMVNFTEFAYITLETDAKDNDGVIKFYEKNGFIRARAYETNEGRKMFEYRYVGEK